MGYFFPTAEEKEAARVKAAEALLTAARSAPLATIIEQFLKPVLLNNVFIVLKAYFIFLVEKKCGIPFGVDTMLSQIIAYCSDNLNQEKIKSILNLDDIKKIENILNARIVAFLLSSNESKLDIASSVSTLAHNLKETISNKKLFFDSLVDTVGLPFSGEIKKKIVPDLVHLWESDKQSRPIECDGVSFSVGAGYAFSPDQVTAIREAFKSYATIFQFSDDQKKSLELFIDEMLLENFCMKLEMLIGQAILSAIGPGKQYPCEESTKNSIADFDAKMQNALRSCNQNAISSFDNQSTATSSSTSLSDKNTDTGSISLSDATLQESNTDALLPKISEPADVKPEPEESLEVEKCEQPISPPAAVVPYSYDYNSMVEFNAAYDAFSAEAEKILSDYRGEQGFNAEKKQQLYIKLDAMQSSYKNIEIFKNYITEQLHEMNKQKEQLQEKREKSLGSTSLVPFSPQGLSNARNSITISQISFANINAASNMVLKNSGVAKIINFGGEVGRRVTHALTSRPEKTPLLSDSVQLSVENESKKQYQVELDGCKSKLGVCKVALKHIAFLDIYKKAVDALCVLDDIHGDAKTENECLLAELKDLLTGCDITADAEDFSRAMCSIKEKALALQQKKNATNKYSVDILKKEINDKKNEIIASNKALLSAIMLSYLTDNESVSEFQETIEINKQAIQGDHVKLQDIAVFDGISAQLDRLVRKLKSGVAHYPPLQNAQGDLDHFNENISTMKQLLSEAIQQPPESTEGMQRCLGTLQREAKALQLHKAAVDTVLNRNFVFCDENNDANFVELLDSISARRSHYLAQQRAQQVNGILEPEIMEVVEDIIKNYDQYGHAIEAAAKNFGKYKVLHDTFKKHEEVINQYKEKREKYVKNLRGNAENGYFVQALYFLLSYCVNIEKIENKINSANAVVVFIKAKDNTISALIDNERVDEKRCLKLIKDAEDVVNNISDIVNQADTDLNLYPQSFFRPRSEYRAALEGLKTELYAATGAA